LEINSDLKNFTKQVHSCSIQPLSGNR